MDSLLLSSFADAVADPVFARKATSVTLDELPLLLRSAGISALQVTQVLDTVTGVPPKQVCAVACT